MDGQVTDARTVSLALFNNASFAEVAVATDRILLVAPHAVTTRQVAAATGRSDSVVRPVMKRLVAAALLREPEGTTGRGPRPYTRGHPEAWPALLALLHEVAAAGVKPR